MPLKAGRTIFFLWCFFVLCFIFASSYIFADGTYSNIGTSDAADCHLDCITFSQGRVWTIDKYGKYIWLTEDRPTGSHHWAWSNDSGVSWAQGCKSHFLIFTYKFTPIPVAA